MIQQQKQPSNPMDRVTMQYEFSKARGRSMVALTVGDLEYIMAMLRQQEPTVSKDTAS